MNTPQKNCKPSNCFLMIQGVSLIQEETFNGEKLQDSRKLCLLMVASGKEASRSGRAPFSARCDGRRLPSLACYFGPTGKQ